MDVVYVCRRGENHELRYSLRSLSNVRHDRVWIFGGHPEWVSNVTVVATPQHGLKYAVTTASLVAACTHPEVSDPFWFWNDDFYAMAEAKPEHYHRGTVRDLLDIYDRAHPTSIYTKGMRATLDRLEQHGHPDPLSYELHVPLVVHKAPMMEAITLGADLTCWHKRTAYGAIANLGGTYTEDVKAYQWAEHMPSGPWFSTNDRTFRGYSDRLHATFPQHCEYEA